MMRCNRRGERKRGIGEGQGQYLVGYGVAKRLGKEVAYRC